MKSDTQYNNTRCVFLYNCPSLYFQVDGATSLIQSAKNLMNSVILTVKSSYIASTKHKQAGGVSMIL